MARFAPGWAQEGLVALIDKNRCGWLCLWLASFLVRVEKLKVFKGI